MEHGLFYGLSIILAVVVAVLALCKVFKQPMIIGYILSWTIVSLIFPELLHSQEALESFSHIGISFLLFMVGMELHPTIIKQLWKDSLIWGLAQVWATTILGTVLGLLLWFDWVTSLFLGIGFSFSSTIVILKLLSDKGNTETIFWRLSIGILVVQDLIVILAFLALATINGMSDGGGMMTLLILLLKIITMTWAIILASKYFIPWATKKISQSTEFLFLFAVAWCFVLGALFDYLWFGMEIGALLAWVSLATSAFRFEIMSRIKPLRDFFIVMFFVMLGSQMTIVFDVMFFVRVLIFSLFILVLKPTLISFILAKLGHTKKNTFLAWITLGQISEFSFLLLWIWVTMWYITNMQLISEITLTGLITIAISSYSILYGEKIYNRVKDYAKYIPGKRHRNYNTGNNFSSEIMIFGYGRFGNSLFDALKKTSKTITVIDENPKIIEHLEKNNVQNIYWDAGNIEFLEELHIQDTKMVVSTLRNFEDNLVLLENIKRRNPKIIMVLLSAHVEESIKFYEEGADYVIMPHYIGANHTSLLLEEFGFDIDKFIKNREFQIKNLRNRHKDMLIDALHKL